MQTCPICGKTIKDQSHWVRCPIKKQPVCMKHCYNGCVHFKNDRCHANRYEALK